MAFCRILFLRSFLFTANTYKTMYKTVLFHFDRLPRVLERGLTLEEAQRICSHADASSCTCTDSRRLQEWGREPAAKWFIGYREE